METRDIKKMFETADEAFPIQEEKKQQTYEKMLTEFRKQRSPVEKMNHIIFNQLFYMDRSALYAYGTLLCLEIVLMTALHYWGIDAKGMMTFCMVAAGIVSMAAIILLDKLFFGEMAELGASCYFSTKQSIVAFLITAESINLVMLLLIMLYVGAYWKIAILQIAVYMLTPSLLSNTVAFAVLSTKTGRRSSYSLFTCGMFLSIGYMGLAAVPNIFGATFIGIWALVCVILAVLLAVEIRCFFRKVEKGELLCMN
ncbi:hypothetical protein [Hespellia stercorisuis]|uniref:Uncharacterized protein n=1 Tax=Hespellia stercorisuis DSM 15480 TaxID=1121950 RepID=A0A1M6QAR6_9FIRM|nr:hypothetical protein [Hespellia stercorisuis]SHK17359.1 hypothetical protein SAMN02745243_02368 [Hespellia stercorisuis DSM 15480]